MRLYGLNAFGVVVASAAFFLVGFLWYGVVFADAWMAAEGVSAAEAEAQSPAWMAGGVVITVLQVVGIGLVLKWRRAHSVGAAMATAFALWLLFALPFTHYEFLYSPAHDPTTLLLDAGHLLVGWLVAALALALIR